jgi:hypothetical protein
MTPEEADAEVDRLLREQLENHRADWEAREAALPKWLQSHMAALRKKGGDDFDLNHWGYQLTIAEMAADYADPDTDADHVTATGHDYATSPRQHAAARALWQAREDKLAKRAKK